jgi:hypothetical protein
MYINSHPKSFLRHNGNDAEGPLEQSRNPSGRKPPPHTHHHLYIIIPHSTQGKYANGPYLETRYDS